MRRWQTKTLGEIATVQMGQSPPGKTYNSDGVGLPFFQGKAEFGEEYPTRVKWCSQPSRIAEAGDILLSVRAPVGPTNFATERCCIGRGLAAIRGEPKECNQRYIRYYLKRFESNIASRGVGSTFTAINRDDIERLELPVPPLEEQERIVRLLDEAGELRKLRAQADRRTFTLIAALFHEMFGDPERNPKRWPSGQLKDFGAEIRYGLGQPPEEDPGGLPLLRATNIKHGYISEIGLIRVRREAVPVTRNAILNADDVLIVRSGAYTGDVARVGEKWAGSVAGYDLVASPNERLAGDFIAGFLLSEFVQDRYFKALKLRAAQPHLNSAQVSETPFFCPPLSLQKLFATRVGEIRVVQAEQTATSRRLEELFQSLLHRAFNGDL